MSKRMAEGVLSDLEITTNVRVRDVEEAQQRVVNIVRNLEGAGRTCNQQEWKGRGHCLRSLNTGEQEASPYIYPRDKQLVGRKKADRLEESEKIEDTYAEECIVQAVEQSEKILNTARKEGQPLKEGVPEKGICSRGI